MLFSFQFLRTPPCCDNIHYNLVCSHRYLLLSSNEYSDTILNTLMPLNPQLVAIPNNAQGSNYWSAVCKARNLHLYFLYSLWTNPLSTTKYIIMQICYNLLWHFLVDGILLFNFILKQACWILLLNFYPKTSIVWKYTW